MLHILYDANEEQEHPLTYINKYILVKFRFASKPTMDNYDKDSRGRQWAVVNRNTHILMCGDKPLPEVMQKFFPDVHFEMASAKWRLFCSCVNAFKIFEAVNPGLGVTKPISPFRYFFKFSRKLKYWLPYAITFIFYRCHRSWAAETPDKYGRGLKYQTYTFRESNFPVSEKLTNGAPPPPQAEVNQAAENIITIKWIHYYKCSYPIKLMYLFIDECPFD